VRHACCNESHDSAGKLFVLRPKWRNTQAALQVKTGYEFRIWQWFADGVESSIRFLHQVDMDMSTFRAYILPPSSGWKRKVLGEFMCM
jgi:hypothetical protein